jgi:hypothetical protein
VKRLLESAAMILVAVALAWPAGRLVRWALAEPPRSPPNGRIVTAAGGQIDEMAIQFHRETGGDAFLPVYAEIFGALSPETTVWVIVTDEADERIFDEARRTWTSPGPRVRYARVGRTITNWARDRMAVLADDEGAPVLVAPPDAHAGALARANDWHVPWVLRSALGARGRIVTAPFAFDGGDLIADESFVYFATPLERRNASRPINVLRHELETLVGRPPLRVGDVGDPAPDHHIGMFVTPLGDGVVAYADPELGSERLFGSAHAEAPRRVITGGRSYEIDERPETRRRFARVESDLERAGLHTVALPMVPTTTPYAWIGYDNVLLDRRPDGLHVLMPTYGLPALDQAAAEIYRSLGATVHPIDVSGIFHHGGTVRCLAAVISRTVPSET